MKRYTCSGCKKQRGVNRLIKVEIAVGAPGHNLPVVTMSRLWFCGECCAWRAGAVAKMMTDTHLSPFVAQRVKKETKRALDTDYPRPDEDGAL